MYVYVRLNASAEVYECMIVIIYVYTLVCACVRDPARHSVHSASMG